MNWYKLLVVLMIIGVGAGSTVIFPANSVMADDEITEIGEPISNSLLDNQELGFGMGLDYVGCTRINTAVIKGEFEQRVVELVNIERAKVGAAPLKRNSELDFATRYHAKDMVDDNYFQHDTMDWKGEDLVAVCNAFERIKLYYPSYSAMGENLAAGYDTPDDVVKGWMSSEGHRKNMLDTKYREIGAGFYEGNADFREYWALDLGSKSDVYPVIINNELSQTSSPNVSLYVYGQDRWAEMRIKTNDSNWSSWMPFQESVNWQLPPVNGTHTLAVEMREPGKITAGAASSDSITLVGYTPAEYENQVFLPLIKR